MDYGLESEVWKSAQRIMPADCFRDVVVDAVTTYRRLPGHSVPERMHFVVVGLQGVEALRLGLGVNGLLDPNDPLDYVSLRAPLRAHLYVVLQWYLIEHSGASGAVVDGYFAHDLGL